MSGVLVSSADAVNLGITLDNQLTFKNNGDDSSTINSSRCQAHSCSSDIALTTVILFGTVFLLSRDYNCDSTAIRLRQDYDEKY